MYASRRGSTARVRADKYANAERDNMETRHHHHDRPQHAPCVSLIPPISRIDWIGRGILSLIERHIAFERSKFVVTAALTAFLRAAILSVAIGVIPSAHANALTGASRAETGTTARGPDP